MNVAFFNIGPWYKEKLEETKTSNAAADEEYCCHTLATDSSF